MSKKSKMAENLRTLQEFSSDSEEQDDAIGQMVYLDVEGFTAEENDATSISNLLAEVMVGMDVNLVDLTDLIITQNYVGCVLKQVLDDKDAMEQDEDDDSSSDSFALGLNTVVNITHKRKLHAACTAAICSGVLKHCDASDALPNTKQQFHALLGPDSTKNVGLVLNERLVNMPVGISFPAFDSLRSDMEAANKIAMPFNFDYYLLICQTYKINTLKSRRKAKKDKKQAQETGSSAMELGTPSKLVEVFYNPEDEVFAEFAELNFEFSVSEYAAQNTQSWCGQEAADKRTSQLRRVLLLPADKLAPAVEAARLKLLS